MYVSILAWTRVVALELLREESAITSAKTTSSHFRSTNQADREFQRISVQERSKFDKETGEL
jgi:hypothetical protein